MSHKPLPDSLVKPEPPVPSEGELDRLMAELGLPYEPKLDYLTPERKRLR